MPMQEGEIDRFIDYCIVRSDIKEPAQIKKAADKQGDETSDNDCFLFQEEIMLILLLVIEMNLHTGLPESSLG
jgi:hypothetical protein